LTMIPVWCTARIVIRISFAFGVTVQFLHRHSTL